MEKAYIELKIPSTVFYIEPVRAFIRNLTQSLGFSRKRVADIQLVLDEICSNAINHGSVNAAVGIKLRICIDADALEILVKDTGRGHTRENSWLALDRLSEIEEKRSPSNESGHGIFIIRSLADAHEMESNEVGGTDVRVIFHREN